MKILAISNLFPCTHEPTRGTFTKQVFQAVSELAEITVVSPRPWWTRLKYPGEILNTPRQEVLGMEAYYPAFWGLPKAGVRYNGDLLYHSLRPLIHRLRRDFTFDIILAAWAYPDAYAAARLARDYGCPLVIKTMGSDINDLATRSELRPQITWALTHATRVISVSKALREKTIELGVEPGRSVFQHNGVNGAIFAIGDKQEAREQLGLPLDRKLITYIGNFYPVKGTDVLVEAMVKLAQTRTDTDLCLVGSGDLGEGLRARVAAAGLSSRVHFPGRQSHDRVPLWMRACDVFCLPSRNEGCPNVVLEALASGRPVVATNVGGIPELIQPGCGEMVPPENPGALALALDRALNQSWDPQQLRSSVQFLSWQEVGQSYYQILKDACAATPQFTRVSPLKGSIL